MTYLSLPPHLPTEHFLVKWLRDGLRQELKVILVAMQFQFVWDLVQVAQGMERVMNDTLRPTSEQNQMTGFKRKNFVPLSRKALYPKKDKGNQYFG